MIFIFPYGCLGIIILAIAVIFTVALIATYWYIPVLIWLGVGLLFGVWSMYKGGTA